MVDSRRKKEYARDWSESVLYCIADRLTEGVMLLMYNHGSWQNDATELVSAAVLSCV